MDPNNRLSGSSNNQLPDGTEINKYLPAFADRLLFNPPQPPAEPKEHYFKNSEKDLSGKLNREFHALTKTIPVLFLDHVDSKLVKIIHQMNNPNIETFVTHSAKDALLMTATVEPEVFIINVSMKGLEPWNLIKFIRNIPQYEYTPILLVSDRELTDSEINKALRLKAQGFIAQPLTAADIAKEIYDVI